MKRLFSTVLAAVSFLTRITQVYAASQSQDAASFTDLENMVKRLITAVGALAGVGLFIVLVLGGFNFLFSGGDAKKLEKAKNAITYAIIGIVVVAGAYLIIQLVAQFTGVQSINTFKIVQ
jgi:hypothetical protein